MRLRAASEDGRSEDRWLPTMTIGTGGSCTMNDSAAAVCCSPDVGKAAATSALLALGLFDVVGGCGDPPVYEITAPVFDRVTFHLHPDFHRGDAFVIEAPGGPGDVYLQAARLDGEPWNRCWFLHERFARGGHLELDLGPAPNRAWGVDDPPPGLPLDGG